MSAFANATSSSFAASVPCGKVQLTRAASVSNLTVPSARYFADSMVVALDWSVTVPPLSLTSNPPVIRSKPGTSPYAFMPRSENLPRAVYVAGRSISPVQTKVTSLTRPVGAAVTSALRASAGSGTYSPTCASGPSSIDRARNSPRAGSFPCAGRHFAVKSAGASATPSFVTSVSWRANASYSMSRCPSRSISSNSVVFFMPNWPRIDRTSSSGRSAAKRPATSSSPTLTVSSVSVRSANPSHSRSAPRPLRTSNG